MNENSNPNNLFNKPRTPGPQGRPFAWQDLATLNYITENFDQKKLTTAKALYVAFTELASNAGGSQGKAVNQFSAYLITIGNRIKKSVSTVKRYAKEFKRLGILSWQSRKSGHKNLANLWILYAHPHHSSEPTPIHKKELHRSAHSHEPPIQEEEKDIIITKKYVDNYRANNGFHSIKDILDKKKE